MAHLRMLIGAVATSTLLALSHNVDAAVPVVYAASRAEWMTWAHGVVIGAGLLFCGMVVVWSASTVLGKVWEKVSGESDSERGEVANAPSPCLCECVEGYVPLLQKCNRATEPCVVCQLRKVVAEHDAAMAQLATTRAILGAIIASAPECTGMGSGELDPSTSP